MRHLWPSSTCVIMASSLYLDLRRDEAAAIASRQGHGNRAVSTTCRASIPPSRPLVSTQALPPRLQARVKHCPSPVPTPHLRMSTPRMAYRPLSSLPRGTTEPPHANNGKRVSGLSSTPLCTHMRMSQALRAPVVRFLRPLGRHHLGSPAEPRCRTTALWGRSHLHIIR